ncbi:MAG TPA: DNA ligase [Gemmata sp.]|nr:DNA ligase [Gemmata sp.]
MPDLADGETFEMQGSGSKPYIIKNVGGLYSCTCPAWRNQSLAINARTCKHIRKLRGDVAEEARIQSAEPLKPLKPEGAAEDADLPVLLAHVWSDEHDPTDWWMSEKLDGVRAYWDGKQFLSRKNNIFYAPDWFTDGLPGHALDGELWIDRKQFDRTSGLVRRQDRPAEWKEIRYLVFDAPDAQGPFEERLKFLKDSLGGWKTRFAAVHDHTACTGLDHLFTELDRVTALGGEGLMLRKPGSMYERTRSMSLLKVKKFLDAEAVVLGYQAGKGRHKGRVGALHARLGNGKEFEVGTGLKDRERESPPAIGSTIKVKYQELTKDGIPRFPVYVGLRPDGNPNAPPPTRETERPPAAAQMLKPGHISLSHSERSEETKMAETASRYFEFVDESSSKFWEIWMNGTDVTTRWGRIGTAGQTKTKTFADEAKAKKEYDKLLAEKIGKGYVEKPRPA